MWDLLLVGMTAHGYLGALYKSFFETGVDTSFYGY